MTQSSPKDPDSPYNRLDLCLRIYTMIRLFDLQEKRNRDIFDSYSHLFDRFILLGYCFSINLILFF